MPHKNTGHRAFPFAIQSAEQHPVTVFQSQGPRTEQQDRFCAFLIKPDDIDLNDLFAAMAAETANLHPASGSTANLAIVGHGAIQASNIGDSFSSLFSREVGSKELKARRLSTTHTPDNSDEIKRLEPLLDPFGTYISNGLLCMNDGMRSPYLMITRALGQHQYGQTVPKTPSDIHQTILAAEGLNIYALALYTDGAVRLEDDWGVDFDQEIDIYAREGLQKGARVKKPMSELMGEFALKQGLRDDTTILSLDLRRLNPEDRFLLGVFDSHGEDGVAYAEKAVETLANHPITLQRIL